MNPEKKKRPKRPIDPTQPGREINRAARIAHVCEMLKEGTPRDEIFRFCFMQWSCTQTQRESLLLEALAQIDAEQALGDQHKRALTVRRLDRHYKRCLEMGDTRSANNALKMLIAVEGTAAPVKVEAQVSGFMQEAADKVREYIAKVKAEQATKSS